MYDLPTTVLGVLHVVLHISLCHSLKEKRSVIKPCIHYLQSHYNVSVAEVEDQDIWGSAVLAVSCVSNEKNVVEQTLNNALKYLERRPDLEVTDFNLEIL